VSDPAYIKTGQASFASSYCQADSFDLWAGVYDEQLNPLLSLEQRFLLRLIPDAEGMSVLDAGCGTGRWLSALSAMSPRSLAGVDTSPEMLIQASAKCPMNADLYHASCGYLPFDDKAIDIVIASFTLSYIEETGSVAREFFRVARTGADIFLADMHPTTAAERGWKRSFRANGQVVELETYHRKISDIVDTFTEAGFELRAIFEPTLGEPERRIFEERDRLEDYASVSTVPAIYIIHLTKAPQPSGPTATHTRFTGARCALGPREVAQATIAIKGGLIGWMSSKPELHEQQASLSPMTVDLSGYMALPGLINAHDHLEFSLFPNLGHGSYENASQWAADIQRVDGELIAKHRSVNKDVRLWWGGIRNLLCGVTTVCHHNPLSSEMLSEEFPIDVLSRFGWAHSVDLDSDVLSKFHDTPKAYPFVIHAAEGTGRESEDQIYQLEQMRVLDKNTVLVHGLALTKDTIRLLNQRGASLVICPSSNRFLFGRTLTLSLLQSVERLALGSDSPLTGKGDLLDEMRFTHAEIGFGSDQVYEMVTTQPSSILGLEQGEGELRTDCVANMIAVRDTGLSPAETLVRAKTRDIELVVQSGRVQLASQVIFDRLPEGLRYGLQVLEADGERRWIRAPLDRLWSETEHIRGTGPLCVGGRRIYRD
jgi:ubiquinone/menaquinone biosynthesis C-methylase UbiE/cytosine/adenosine deaminase-related metal-dependent hydrolase